MDAAIMITDLDIPQHWKDVKVIGRGSFSTVYSVYDVFLTKSIAVKIPNNEESVRVLAKEAATFRSMRHCKSKSNAGIPQFLDYSPDGPTYLSMQKMGKTLLALNSELNRLSLKTILMVAIKAITALEEIHSCGYIHCDVKPDNIAVGPSPKDPRIYFLDMGLSNRYMSGGMHVLYSEKNSFQGSPFFASFNSLRGVRPTRRDDLESLGYILVYLCLGELPWFNVTAVDPIFEIRKVRKETPVSVLCGQLDREFRVYLQKCQSYGYSDKPNYEHLRSLFRELAVRKQIPLDWKYDWTPSHGANRSVTVSTLPTQVYSTEKTASLRVSHRMKVLSSMTHIPHPSHTLEQQGDSADTPVHRLNQLPTLWKDGRHEHRD